MKITFLGTACGVATKIRHSSSTLIETGGKAYLIDAGAPVTDILTRMEFPFDSLKAVFLTHSHGDHTLGLPALYNLTTWFYKSTAYEIYYPSQECADAFRNLIYVTDRVNADDRIKPRVVSEGKFYDDGTLSVTAIKTRHMERAGLPSFAFLVEAEGKRVLFTGDLSVDDASDFPQTAYDVHTNLIVCEFAHFMPDAIFPKLEKAKTDRVIFNHISLLKDRQQALQAALSSHSLNASIASDSDTVNL